MARSTQGRDGAKSGKEQIGVRVSSDCAKKLHQAAYLLRKSQSTIVEEALLDYFDKNSFKESYQLHVLDNSFILMSVAVDGNPVVRGVVHKNGVPAEQIAKDYEAQLRMPVAIVNLHSEKK